MGIEGEKHISLSERWSQTWSELGLSARPGLFETMVSRWGESHRRYHNLQHLIECLQAAEALRPFSESQPLVEFALWYHDAFHNTMSQGQEIKSAELARTTVLKSGGSFKLADRVSEVILATTHDRGVHLEDAAVVCDCDLWILGSPIERFQEYNVQIREEYKHVQDKYYIKGRIRVLRKFASRSFIYRTPLFRDLFEMVAKENLKGEIERLESL